MIEHEIAEQNKAAAASFITPEEIKYIFDSKTPKTSATFAEWFRKRMNEALSWK